MKNQKFLSLAVSALVAVSGVSGCLAVPAFCTSAESETLTFEMTNIDYNPKDSVQYVDVFVTQIPDGTEVYAMQGSISYDASALELVEVPADSCYGLVVTNESEGCLRWSIETNDPNMMPLEAKEGDTVIYFGFKVKDTANNGVYQIKWDRDYTMASSLENLLYGGSLPLTITDGSITVNRSTTTTTLPETTTTTTTTVPATTTTTTATVPATTTVPETTTTTTTTVPVITTTTTTTIPATTTTTPATTLPKPSLAGDANCDKTVDIADVVLIKCYIINPNEYKLSAQGFANADVHGSSNGLNAQDAVAIAKHILHVIPSLSELK